MSSAAGGAGKAGKVKKLLRPEQVRAMRRQRRDQRKMQDMREIEDLSRRVLTEAPARGTNPLAMETLRSSATNKSSSSNSSSSSSSSSSSNASTDDANNNTPGHASSAAFQYTGIRRFDELPISLRTKTALQASKFTRLTDIQRAAIPHALAGRDILAAARTGSGKTLAFVIPVIELLYRTRWTRDDGLCALIITPTRELALQIFDVLRAVGLKHEFSAGLVIGGKDLAEEQACIARMGLIVCTPGRLLQHMDQTVGFDCSNVKMLVLDEADRILDMGFKQTLDDVVANLPKKRQTLLFSATQTKSVRDLARLSLRDPEYLAVHDHDVVATPNKLEQRYMVIDADRKFDLVFSFIKTHLRAKSLVFVSSCKQVRFMYEMFRRIRPGVPLMHLHGKMKQMKRMATYYDFCNKKDAVLFCTDIAARGLDFPEVDWVVQMDCPDSVQTYIHRVGRTARYRSGGKALMFLLPSELTMIDDVKAARVHLDQVNVNPDRMVSVTNQFESFIAETPDLKYLAQKALISYLRSVHLQTNKAVFNTAAIPVDKLAAAMGLPGTPKIKNLGGSSSQRKNMPHALRELMGVDKPQRSRVADDDRGMTTVDRLLARKNNTVLSEARLRMLEGYSSDSDGDEGDGEDEDDVLVVKRKNHELESSDDDDDDDSDDESDEEEEDEEEEEDAGDDDRDDADDEKPRKREERRKRKMSIRDVAASMVAADPHALPDVTLDVRAKIEESKGFVQSVAARLKEEDVVDRAREHERVHSKHILKRQSIKRSKQRTLPQSLQQGAVLGGANDEDEDGGYEYDDGGDDDGDEDEDEEEDYDSTRSAKRARFEDDDEEDEEDAEEEEAEEDEDEGDHRRRSSYKRHKSSSSSSSSSSSAAASLHTQEELAMRALGM